jgi:hypothetical protein
MKMVTIIFRKLRHFTGKEKAPQFMFAEGGGGGCGRLLIVADLNTIFLF